MKYTALDLFDSIFSVHNRETDGLLVDIILDRKYNIPEWMYQYITEDVLVTIIMNSKNIEEFKHFILTINDKCKFNDKYLCSLLVDTVDTIDVLFNYAIILNPKKLYKYIVNNDISLNPDCVFSLIRTYVKYYNDIAPTEYYHILTYSIIKDRAIEKMNYKKIFCSQLNLLYTPILSNSKAFNEPNLFDMFFKGLYRTYDKIIMSVYNNDPAVSMDKNPTDLLKYYWSKGGTYVPRNLSLNYCKVYMDTMIKYNSSPEFSDDLVFILDKHKTDLTDDMKADIMDTISLNICNIKLLVWDLTDKERLYVKDVYKSYRKSNMKNMNFSKYMSIVSPDDPLIPFSSCKKFIQRGGKVDIRCIQVDDMDDFIDCIMKYLTDDELNSYFEEDLSVYFFTRKTSILKYIVDSCIKYSKGSNILNRFYSIVFNNEKIVDLIIDNSYATYSELTSKTTVDVVELLSQYPKLLKYQASFPPVLIYCIIKANPDAIEYIPWKYLPQDLILNRISSKGYFPIMIDERDHNNIEYREPAKYLDTTKLLAIMKCGVGLGYCIDYTLPEYIKAIFKILLEEEK